MLRDDCVISQCLFVFGTAIILCVICFEYYIVGFEVSIVMFLYVLFERRYEYSFSGIVNSKFIIS